MVMVLGIRHNPPFPGLPFLQRLSWSSLAQGADGGSNEVRPPVCHPLWLHKGRFEVVGE